MPIFCVKSVKIYTGQKKIYTGAARGARNKYEVCTDPVQTLARLLFDGGLLSITVSEGQ